LLYSTGAAFKCGEKKSRRKGLSHAKTGRRHREGRLEHHSLDADTGDLGVFPPPTQELYNTPEAFAFIETITAGRYITIIMVLVHVVALCACGRAEPRWQRC
jgi:hypothetical protein